MGILFDLLILHLVAYSKDIIRPIAKDLGSGMLSIVLVITGKKMEIN